MTLTLKKLATWGVCKALLAGICLNLSVSVNCSAEALLAEEAADAPAPLNCPANYRPQIMAPHYDNQYDYYEWSSLWTDTGGPGTGSCVQFETQVTLPDGQINTVYNNELRCFGRSRRYSICYVKKGGTRCEGDAIRVVEDEQVTDLGTFCAAKEFAAPLMEVARKGKCEAPELIQFVCESAADNVIEGQAAAWIDELYDSHPSRRVRAVCCVPLTLGIPVIDTIDEIRLDERRINSRSMLLNE